MGSLYNSSNVRGSVTPVNQIHTQFSPLFSPYNTHYGLEGQPPVQYEHEVVTGNGEVDTLLQATR